MTVYVFLYNCIEYRSQEFVPTSDSNLVTSCMTLLEILMKDIHENDHKYVKTWLAVSYARIFI